MQMRMSEHSERGMDVKDVCRTMYVCLLTHFKISANANDFEWKAYH